MKKILNICIKSVCTAVLAASMAVTMLPAGANAMTYSEAETEVEQLMDYVREVGTHIYKSEFIYGATRTMLTADKAKLMIYSVDYDASLTFECTLEGDTGYFERLIFTVNPFWLYYRDEALTTGTFNYFYGKDSTNETLEADLRYTVENGAVTLKVSELKNRVVQLSDTDAEAKVKDGYARLIAAVDTCLSQIGHDTKCLGIGQIIEKNVDDNYYDSGINITSVVTKKKGFIISWTGPSDAGEYEVEYSTRKDFQKATIVRMDAVNNPFIKVKNLKPGKTYYVRVCAVRDDGVYYGYSATQEVTPGVKK